MTQRLRPSRPCLILTAPVVIHRVLFHSHPWSVVSKIFRHFSFIQTANIGYRTWRKTIQTANLPSIKKHLMLQLQACTANLQRYRAEAAKTAAAMSAAVFTTCGLIVGFPKDVEASSATFATTTASFIDRATFWVRLVR